MLWLMIYKTHQVIKLFQQKIIKLMKRLKNQIKVGKKVITKILAQILIWTVKLPMEKKIKTKTIISIKNIAAFTMQISS